MNIDIMNMNKCMLMFVEPVIFSGLHYLTLSFRISNSEIYVEHFCGMQVRKYAHMELNCWTLDIKHIPENEQFILSILVIQW